MYLTQGLHRAAQRDPRKRALCHVEGANSTDSALERTLSYGELIDRVARQAAALQSSGIVPGDRVALLAPNSDLLIMNILACWWLGAVACPLNTRWTATELRAALADCGARLLIADATLHAAAQALHEGPLTVAGSADFATQAQARAPLPDCRAGGDTLAAILYTGGTTGRSKGVMLTHANFWASAMSRAAELSNPADGVSLLVAPLFHVAGLGRLIGQIIAGATCVTLPQFHAGTALEIIERHAISDIMVVPTMLQSLLDHPGFDAARAQSLTRIAFGAAPMPPDLLLRALAAWPHAVFFQAYGLTESAASVCINLPAQHLDAQGCPGPRINAVGRVGLGAEIRVVDEMGLEVPRGQVGEIVIRGPMVTQGYWGQPQASAQALREGWLHTGDGGRMDGQGYLYIVDRLKDMVITGGENVYPAEVEIVLRQHPAVAEAAVIGLPDAHWGERVHAVVVPKTPAAVTDAFAGELIQFCRQSLAGYKCPRSIDVADTLPLSAAGKVLKTALRARQAAAAHRP